MPYIFIYAYYNFQSRDIAFLFIPLLQLGIPPDIVCNKMQQGNHRRRTSHGKSELQMFGDKIVGALSV
jgi:hypothetical protein